MIACSEVLSIKYLVKLNLVFGALGRGIEVIFIGSS